MRRLHLTDTISIPLLGSPLEFSEFVYDSTSDNINWDGADRTGKAVASGVYLCRLESNGSVASRKMVLLN